MFDFLKKKGYTLCPLERKSYNSVEVEQQEVKCPKCGNEWTAEFTKERKVMKSNVDVYLATELLTMAHQATQPIHIILVSCDGDYAETIRNAIENNENIVVSVLATPSTRDFTKNTLSVRLKQLYTELLTERNRYHLRTIADVDCFSQS